MNSIIENSLTVFTTRKHQDSLCCSVLFSVLQVQTQPLTCVALVSWDWCTRCTLWWTQRLYRWRETSTSYRNTLHRYHKRHSCKTVCSCRVSIHVLYSSQISPFPQRLWNTSHPVQAWPWPLSSLQRELEQKECRNVPSGISKSATTQAYLRPCSLCNYSLWTYISWCISSVSELSIQCDVNQHDPHRSASTQRGSLVQVSHCSSVFVLLHLLEYEVAHSPSSPMLCLRSRQGVQSSSASGRCSEWVLRCHVSAPVPTVEDPTEDHCWLWLCTKR